MASKLIEVTVKFVMGFDEEQQGISPELERVSWTRALHPTLKKLGVSYVVGTWRALKLLDPPKPRKRKRSTSRPTKGGHVSHLIVPWPEHGEEDECEDGEPLLSDYLHGKLTGLRRGRIEGAAVLGGLMGMALEIKERMLCPRCGDWEGDLGPSTRFCHCENDE
jgi:hypothetical protein